jgi:uncharacterized protein YjbI with pentapeptide repeats
VTTTIPRPPRIPARLTDLTGWPAIEDLPIADALWRGDFSDRTGEDLTVERTHILDAQFTAATLTRLHLTDVLVENSVFSGADLDESVFTRVEFRDCRVSGADLTRCSFSDVTISTSRFDRANFRMSVAKALHFDQVDLRGGDFYGATLEGTRFFDCDLTGAQFSKARTPGLRFHGSTLLDLQGSGDLAGSVIESSQVLPLALSALAALEIAIDDEREP